MDLTKIFDFIDKHQGQFFLALVLILLSLLLKRFRSWYKHNKEIFSNPNDLARQRRINVLLEGKFYHFYLDKLSAGLDRVAKIIGDGDKFVVGAPELNGLAAIGCRLFGFHLNPWTERSFNFSILLALTYPVLIVIAFWGLFGGAGDIGGLDLLSNSTSQIGRFVFLMALLLSTMFFYRSLAARGGKKFLWFVSGFGVFGVAYVETFAVAVVGIVAIQAAITAFNFRFRDLYPTIAHTVAQVIVDAFILSVFGAVAVLFFVVVIGGVIYDIFSTSDINTLGFFMGGVLFAVLMSVVVSIVAGSILAVVECGYFVAKKIEKPYLLSAIFLFAILFGAYFFFYSAHQWEISSSILTSLQIIILFLLILPLTNAPLDWLSLGVTRGLLYAIAHEKHSAPKALWWALLDFGIALIFLALTAVVLTVSVSFANWLSIAGGGETVFSLAQVFCDMSNGNALNQDHWWIYAMLLTTLIPTFLHCVFR